MLSRAHHIWELPWTASNRILFQLDKWHHPSSKDFVTTQRDLSVASGTFSQEKLHPSSNWRDCQLPLETQKWSYLLNHPFCPAQSLRSAVLWFCRSITNPPTHGDGATTANDMDENFRIGFNFQVKQQQSNMSCWIEAHTAWLGKSSQPFAIQASANQHPHGPTGDWHRPQEWFGAGVARAFIFRNQNTSKEEKNPTASIGWWLSNISNK